MSLVKASLKSDIQSILGENADSSKDFADDLVDAYDTYASKAQDVSEDGLLSPLTITPATSGILEGALMAVNNKGITEETAILLLGTALGTMLSSMWIGVTFAITAPGLMGTAVFTASELLSIVTVPGVPTAAMITSLKPTEDLSKAAGVWADAMDAFTKTVIVTITGMVLVPGGPPVPGPPILGPI